MPEATDFGTFGRFEETSVGDMPVDMKEAYDFTIKVRRLVSAPHRIWLAKPELSKTVAPIGAYYQTRSSVTKAEIEIATNIINGHWSAAPRRRPCSKAECDICTCPDVDSRRSPMQLGRERYKHGDHVGVASCDSGSEYIPSLFHYV
jgi:hypothetical protein